MVWWLSGSVDSQICDPPVNDSNVVFMNICLSVCACACVCRRLEREKAMYSCVMYLMITEAYGVCAFIKLYILV